ncbi:hypothetical protein GGR50DRAFT_660696 [Xylaria sp. CBS 124048]|nr:hypothetical protein GGR50DRAFT_660696 [Xylaria sp. CBS 124048]
MPPAAPTPPLLLTKRLTAFLRANLSPQIHTTLLATISGKLLAHASSYPVSILRTKLTVAASIWSIYAAPSTTAALEQAPPPPPPPSSPSSHAPPARPGLSMPRTITLQLGEAIMMITYLHCDLLFICIGPPSELPESASLRQPNRPTQNARRANSDPQPSGSPSEVDSIASTGAASTATATSVGAAAATAMRRQAEELAHWLNDRLGTLEVPSDTAGFEIR